MELIDRNAILNRYQEICGGVACLGCPFNKDGCAFEKLILESAVVDAEPVRHGKWIECESENGIHFHKCSECGKRDMYQGTFTDWGGRGFSFYFKRKYCPVCGALMDLDEVNDGTETD